MTGPWEQYQAQPQQPQRGPWEQYQAAPQPAPGPRVRAAAPAPQAPPAPPEPALASAGTYQQYIDAQFPPDEILGIVGEPANDQERALLEGYRQRWEMLNGAARAAPDLPGSAPSAPGSSADTAIDLSTVDRQAVQGLRRGQWVREPGSEPYQLPSDPFIDYNVRSTDRDTYQPGVYIRDPNPSDATMATVAGAAEQIPFADEAAAGIAGLLTGRGYDEMRLVQGMNRDLERGQYQGQRNAGGIAGFGLGLLAPGGQWAAGAKGIERARRLAVLGAGYGGLYGAGAQDGGLEQRAAAGVESAALGMVTGPALDRLIGRLTTRAAQAADSPQRQLSRMGVDLTPGQMAGGSLQRFEDTLTSTPFLGDAIQTARRRGVESFNRTALNRALQEGGLSPLARSENVGRDGIRTALDRFGAGYGDTLAPVSVAREPAFNWRVEAIISKLRSPTARREVSSEIDDALEGLTEATPGDVFKEIDSTLAALAREAEPGVTSGRPNRRAVQRAYRSIREELRGLLERQHPEAAQALDRLDTGRATLQRILDAGANPGTSRNEGLIAPGQLNSAVARSSRRDFSRGDALLQDLTDPAMQVLPSTVPDSGTPFRSLMTQLLPVGGGAAGVATAAGQGGPALGLLAGLGAATGAGAAVYSAPVQKAVNALYRAKAPGAVRQSLARLATLARDDPALLPLYRQLLAQFGPDEQAAPPAGQAPSPALSGAR